MTTTPDTAPTTALPELVMPWPVPALRGRVRSVPEDFVVRETLSFEPSGAGEHAFVRIRKRGLDTAAVVRRLAACAGVRARAVGIAGRKDRHAVTEQWFSVHLPGRPDPDWSVLEDADLQVLAVTRNARKLRLGALTGNRFCLVLRDLRGDRAGAQAVLARIRDHGLPNYFGAQRFGHAGANTARARRLLVDGAALENRLDRSMALSAARSAIFNAVLAARVRAGTWDRLLPGDVLMLDGRHSVFRALDDDPALPDRLRALEVHPTGPLWGIGPSLTDSDCAALEARVAQDSGGLAAGLERIGMQAARRALRVRARDLAWTWAGTHLTLEFGLPAGAFASVLVQALGAFQAGGPEPSE